MNNEVDAEVLNGYRLCFASCWHELQEVEQHKQHALYKRLDRFRKESIAAHDEPRADAAFIAQTIVSGLINHLQLWLLVKAGRMVEAWDELVDAQKALKCVRRFKNSELLDHWYKELLALEQLLFPPQQFISDAHYWDYALCSICGATYSECDHLAGRLYMGEICVKRPHKVVGIDHVAFVDHPRDKGCRILKYKDGDYMHCSITRQRLETAEEGRGDAEVCILRAR